MRKTTLFWGLSLLLGLAIHAQSWKKVPWSSVENGHILFNEPMPTRYAFFKVQAAVIEQKLKNLYNNLQSTEELVFPVDVDGNTETFSIEKYRIYPQNSLNPSLKTYTARGRSKTGKTLYLSVSPWNIYGIVYHLSEPEFVLKSYTKDVLIGFSMAHYQFDQDEFQDEFQCEIDHLHARAYNGLDGIENEQNPYEGIQMAPASAFQRPASATFGLNIFTTAIYPKWVYTQHLLDLYNIPYNAPADTIRSLVMNSLINAVMRLNGVFERDVHSKFEIAANNHMVVRIDSLSDPLANSDTSDDNHWVDTLNYYVGAGNYNFRQLWGVGRPGGITYATIPCYGSLIAQARHPGSERYVMLLVAHENGHKMGAYYHLYSSTGCYDPALTSYPIEVGSGTTIMSYPGLCNPWISKRVIPRFNAYSIQQMLTTITSSTCQQIIPYSNNPPTVNAGPDKTIPKLTPFVLTASASDPDGDHLTYAWDEIDPADYSTSIDYSTKPQPTWTKGPLFRNYFQRDTNVRYFPIIDSIVVGNIYTEWEVLPSVSRDLKFVVTVRDNHYPAGQVAMDTVVLHVDSTSGPFRITSQQTAENWQPGDVVTVQWDVAGTDQPPVNCQYVDIIASYDAGRHFSDTIAAMVPNSGSYTFTVPNVHSPSAKIMVKAHDNYFLSVTPAQITIGNYNEYCDHYHLHAPHTPFEGVMHIEDTLYVAENNYVTDLNVRVKLDTIETNKIHIAIEGPDHQEVVLWDRHCGDVTPMDLTFDDESTNISCFPLVDTSRPPWESLAVFQNKYTQGPWILKIDYEGFATHPELIEWELQFCVLLDVMGIPNEKINDIHIFPNPFTGGFTVDFPYMNNQMVEITLTDMNGRIIYAQTYMPQGTRFVRQINPGNIGQGVYFIRVQQGNASFEGKLVKQ